jgi:hypothetical protein
MFETQNFKVLPFTIIIIFRLMLRQNDLQLYHYHLRIYIL